MNVSRLVSGELVGADDDLIVQLERPELASLDRLVVRLRFEIRQGRKNLSRQFLMPLLSKVRRRDDEDPAFAFRPSLGEHQARLDGLPEADLVGKQDAA